MRQAQDQGSGAQTAGTDSQSNGAAPAETQDTVTNRGDAQQESAAEQLARLSKDYQNAQKGLTQAQQRASRSDQEVTALQQQVATLQSQVQQYQAATAAPQTPQGANYEGYGEMDEAAARRVAQLESIVAQQNSTVQELANQLGVVRDAARLALENDKAQQTTTQQSQTRNEIQARFPGLGRDQVDYLASQVASGDVFTALDALKLAEKATMDSAKQETQRQVDAQADAVPAESTTSRKTEEPAPIDTERIKRLHNSEDRVGEFWRQKIERASKTGMKLG
jgi:acetyl/propionyl-CoA carboxylase alpha subunit